MTLPAELGRLSARLSLSMPSDELLATIVREEAARWAERNHGRRVRTDNARELEAITQTSPLSVIMAERLSALRQWADGRTVMAC